MKKPLYCTACGMQGEAKCNCGKPLDYIPANKAAALGIAAHPDWSDRRIAEAVGTSDMTIGRIRKSGATNVAPEKRVGRDGKKQSATKHKTPKRDIVQAAVDTFVKAGEPVPRKKLATEYGVGEHTVEAADIAARARLEAEAQITPEDLSMTARQKLEAAIKQHQRRLDAKFDQTVLKEIKRRVEKLVLPSHQQTLDDAALVLKARKGIFTQKEYNAILRCVHPDLSPTIVEKNEAFQLLHMRRLVLLSNKDDPVKPSKLPTVDEFMRG